MIRPILASILFFLVAGVACAADPIGFREITIADAGRPLHVALWYPAAASGPEETVAENRVFYGITVVKDAAPEKASYPLVLLSHGYGGSWRNLSWLAADLVHQGYVVAAVDHPGTTTFDRDPRKAAALWERPRDVSRVLDALIADKSLAIAEGRIAAIGHSLGGWTVAELAGGRFDAARITQDCEARFGPIACKLFAELGIGRDAASTESLKGDLSDARIGAVVTLDLGPARGFTPESLAAVHVPFLVIAAGADIGKDAAAKGEVAATNEDSHYLAALLPKATTTSVVITDALHFSFMQICKPGAIDLIEAETPGESIVCKDGGTRDRETIHREVAAAVTDFLAKALPAQ